MGVHLYQKQQEVELFLSTIPQGLTWGISEEEKVKDLWELGKKVSNLRDESQIIFRMAKPFEENDDPNDNMLNWEDWRMEFEKTNEHHKKFKLKQQELKDNVLEFMGNNILIFAFSVLETKKTLCDVTGIFNKYDSFESTLIRMSKVAHFLERKNWLSLNQSELREQLYSLKRGESI